jgi:hypothetical protein
MQYPVAPLVFSTPVKSTTTTTFSSFDQYAKCTVEKTSPNNYFNENALYFLKNNFSQILQTKCKVKKPKI